MISIVSNVARHVDFMTSSVKYLSMEAHLIQEDIFAVRYKQPLFSHHHFILYIK